jgi:hypothetical protein
MGYSVATFVDIAKLNLQSSNILDIGAQDVTITSLEELNMLNTFIELKKPNNALSLTHFPTIVEAKEVYERAGYRYTNIDVDERPGTLRVDLASFNIPRPRGGFDLVVNVGTTEHLASPVSTFAIMHELCANGGYLYNDVPLFGMGNHGLINPTPKFWHALIWMNQYKLFCTQVRSADEASIDQGNFYHDYLSYFEGLSAVKNITYLIRCVFQKTHDNIFVAPFDAVFPNSDDGRSLAKLLAGSYYPFLCTGAYTEAEVIAGINAFLALNQRPYRVQNLSDLLSLGTNKKNTIRKKVTVSGLLKSFLYSREV